jgi:hypothetical protein
MEMKVTRVNAHEYLWMMTTYHNGKVIDCWLTREGIKPLAKKVEAMLNIAKPQTKKELRHFIGMINYYRGMRVKRSENRD